MKNPFKKEPILTPLQIEINKINMVLMAMDQNDPDYEILCDRRKVLYETALLDAQTQKALSEGCSHTGSSLLKAGAGIGVAAGLTALTKDHIFPQNNLVWNSIKKINFFDLF